jgi:hypothetical protein
MPLKIKTSDRIAKQFCQFEKSMDGFIVAIGCPTAAWKPLKRKAGIFEENCCL